VSARIIAILRFSALDDGCRSGAIQVMSGALGFSRPNESDRRVPDPPQSR